MGRNEKYVVTAPQSEVLSSKMEVCPICTVNPLQGDEEECATCRAEYKPYSAAQETEPCKRCGEGETWGVKWREGNSEVWFGQSWTGENAECEAEEMAQALNAAFKFGRESMRELLEDSPDRFVAGHYQSCGVGEGTQRGPCDCAQRRAHETVAHRFDPQFADDEQRVSEKLYVGLKHMMTIYEQWIRSRCETPHQLERKPWASSVEWKVAQSAIDSFDRRSIKPSNAVEPAGEPRCTCKQGTFEKYGEYAGHTMGAATMPAADPQCPVHGGSMMLRNAPGEPNGSK